MTCSDGLPQVQQSVGEENPADVTTSTLHSSQDKKSGELQLSSRDDKIIQEDYLKAPQVSDVTWVDTEVQVKARRFCHL